jgi:hypothetical protein
MWHAWGRREVFTGFWLGGPKVRDHWEGRPRHRWEDNIKMDLRYGSIGRTGFGWLRIGSTGRIV